MGDRPDIPALYRDIRAGHRSALGRGLTLIESSSPADETDRLELLDLAASDTRGLDSTHRIAVTGVPGSGKSTLVDAIGSTFVDAGRRVAVLAIDPSSDRTGGSILGDKTRMERLAAHEHAFVRPSPTRGHSGGVASTTRESINLCEAAGYDTILVETVGVGQSETGVSEVVDLVVLLLLSGAGDSLQGIKRGILEIADLIAVNKADGENETSARRTASELAQALHILRPEADHPRFVRAVSALARQDVELLAEDISDVIGVRRREGAFADRRAAQRVDWFEAAIDARLRRRLRNHTNYTITRDRLAAAVRSGAQDPSHAARELVDLLLGSDR